MSVIDILYYTFAGQPLDSNPIETPEYVKAHNKLMDKYDNDDTAFFDIQEVINMAQQSAFTVGFKVAMQIMREGDGKAIFDNLGETC